MNRTFIPTADVGALSKLAADALRTSSALLETMYKDLPEKATDRLREVLQGGGRVGIELCVDAHGKTSVSLVAIELEGMRRVVAEVSTVGGESGSTH